MPRPTNFYPGSDVGRMWSDLLAQAKNMGRDIDALEQEVDCGFEAGLPVFGPPSRQNIKGTIEAEEVLEYAYSHSEFILLPQRYGFPAPAEMYDQDPNTEPARRAVADIVSRRQGELANVPGLDKFSDRYRRELARRIYDDMLVLTSKWESPCEKAEPAWKAFNDKCGVCSERSSILYYAYQLAGLKPIVIGTSRTTTNVSDMAMFVAGNKLGPGHEYVGIPLDSGKILTADLALQRFDANNPYSTVLSQRQHAIMFLAGRKNKTKSDDEYNSVIRQLTQIAPAASIFAFLALDNNYMHKKMTPAELESKISPILARYGSSDINLYYAQNLRDRNASFQNRSFDPKLQFDLLDRIGAAMPMYAGFEATDLAMTLLDGLDPLKKDVSTPEQFDALRKQKAYVINLIGVLLIKAINWDPTYSYAFYQLQRLCFNYLHLDESLALWQRLAASHPDHAYIQFQLANWFFSKRNSATTREGADSAYNEGMKIIQNLIGKLAPRDFMVRSLATLYLTDHFEPQKGLQRARETFALLPKTPHPFIMGAYANIFSAAINANDVQLKEQVLERWKRDAGPQWPSQVAHTLIERGGVYYTAGEVRAKSAADVSARITRMISFFDELDKNGLPKNDAEALAAVHAVFSIVRGRAQGKSVELFLSRIKDRNAPHVTNALKSVTGGFVVPIFKSAKLTEDKIQVALRVIEDVEALLAPQDKPLLLDVYRRISLSSADFQNENVARAALHHVTLADKAAGARWFYDEACRVRVTDSHPAAKRNQDGRRVLVALKVLFAEASVLDAKLLDAAITCCNYVAQILDSTADPVGARTARDLAAQFRRLPSR